MKEWGRIGTAPGGSPDAACAVDLDGNVYGAESPISREPAGGGLTGYGKR